MLRWFANDAVARAVLALELASDECVHVYRNGIEARLRAQGTHIERLNALIDLVDLVPQVPHAPGITVVDGIEFHVEDLPEDLRVLRDEIVAWAVGDDADRAERLSNATHKTLARLRAKVEPLLPRIHSYLGECGEPLPAAAILLGNLAEAVAELPAGDEDR